ncbi:unnamed protein product [Cochlearia groenlandica]
MEDIKLHSHHSKATRFGLRKVTSLRSFDELRFGFSSEPVYARLIHSWEIQNLRENSPMGLEMFFIDAKVETITAFIPACHMAEYKSMLRKSTIYKLNQIMVVPSRAVRRVSTITSSICFTEYTTVSVAKLTTHIIDEDLFRQRIYEELANIADENSDLFVVKLCVWHYGTKSLSCSAPWTESNVVLITTINPKHIGGISEEKSGSSSHVQGGKKKEMIGEVFVCTFPECKNEEAHSVPRFRFEAFVGDKTSTATFVIVDSVGQKIVEQTTTTLVEVIVEDDGVESIAFTPQCFKDLIGHTKKIEIRVILDTQDDSRHDIIVTRIFPAAE